MSSLEPDVSAASFDGRSAVRSVRVALSRKNNWQQLARFAVVGSGGYIVNISLYVLLLRVVGLHYLAAALLAFVVAVLNNYLWNRRWTFRAERAGLASQGARFVVVSTTSGALNLVLLDVLVSAGSGEIVAQVLSVLLVTPLNFVGNKLWAFRVSGVTRQLPCRRAEGAPSDDNSR